MKPTASSVLYCSVAGVDNKRATNSSRPRGMPLVPVTLPVLSSTGKVSHLPLASGTGCETCFG